MLWEGGGWVECVCHDLEKAFDEVPNKQLIWKLEHVGELKRVSCSGQKTSREINRWGW